MSRQTVGVVYVAGDGRSGTTILSRILGSYDGLIAVGELYDIWTKTIRGGGLCSCGADFRDCAFWNAVMTEAYGGFDEDLARYAVDLRGSVQGFRHVPYLATPALRTAAFRRRLQEYVELTERLYLAVQRVSGCDFIVDSSKLAAYARVLSESPRVDVRFLHIVRDSRACAYSWRRLKREPTSGDREVYLRQRSLIRSATVWTMRNATLALARRAFPVSTTLRYEDFVARPREAMDRVIRELAIPIDGPSPVAEDGVLTLRPGHVFAGNPNRVEQGEVRVRSDNEWRERMPQTHRGLVYTLTLPALWRFGYLGSRGSAESCRQLDVATQGSNS